MNQKYLVKKVGEDTFKFKMDLNPLTKQYEPHIWHRHLITPDDAIRAFFTISEEKFNEKYNRYEAYSASYDTTLYYMKLKEKIHTCLLLQPFMIGDKYYAKPKIFKRRNWKNA